MQFSKMARRTALLLGLTTSALSLPATAEEAKDWYARLDLSGMYGAYQDSNLRSSVASQGVTLSLDYLEQWGITVGLKNSHVNFSPVSSTSDPDINQLSFFASGRKIFTPDGLPGKLITRMDFHTINNDDGTGNTDNVDAFAPQIAFVDYGKRYYLDLGYAYSSYPNDFEVNQWAPTVGFAFNNAADWLQIRGYFISLTDPNQINSAVDDTAAVELKLTHWFDPSSPLKLDSVQLGTLIGERVFAVDFDGAEVFNLADTQTGSYSLTGNWRLDDNLDLSLLLGYSTYENKSTQDRYDSPIFFVNVGKQW
ncbi:hypothetical protein ACQZV8_01595 [Magnetococcales bacterium HHB-1]